MYDFSPIRPWAEHCPGADCWQGPVLVCRRRQILLIAPQKGLSSGFGSTSPLRSLYPGVRSEVTLELPLEVGCQDVRFWLPLINSTSIQNIINKSFKFPRTHTTYRWEVYLLLAGQRLESYVRDLNFWDVSSVSIFLKEERIVNHNLSYNNWWSWFEGTQSAPRSANKAVESCFSALTNQALPHSQCQQSQYGWWSRLK